MKCNCIEEAEQNALKHLKESYPDKNFSEELNRFNGTGMQNTLLSFGEDGGYRTYNEFKVESSFTKVNGTQSRPKKESVNIIHSFCPFCGVSKELADSNPDDRETISDEAHEIAYVAKKFNIFKSHVMRIKEDLDTNNRAAVYAQIEKDLVRLKIK